MAESLKNARMKAKAKLTRELRKVEEAIEDDFSTAEIRGCLEGVNAASDELEDAHEQYVLVLTEDDERTDAASYLEDEIK